MRPFNAKVLALILGGILMSGMAYCAEFDVVKAGAVGDGVVDNTAVFQKALDEAGKAGGGIVNVPTGQYRINGNLVIPAGVTLQGTFRVPPCNRRDPHPQLLGSVLLAYAGRGKADTAPFIRLGDPRIGK